MKNVFKIFKRDIKKITTNWVALVVVIGLIILPSLYAWFNIKSSWDPYGSTSGIKIAIVNEDNGAKFNDKKIDVGESVVKELSKNKDIGWQFVDKEKAEKGVRMGDYFASIIIPKNFSEDLISPASDDIVKPKLIYTVNESANAIAPKITDKGVQALKNQIDDKVSEVVNGAIFKALNDAGIEYESSRDKIREAIDLIYKVNNNMPEIENLINKAYDGTITIDEMLVKINKIVPQVENTLVNAENALNTGKGYIKKANESFNKLSPIIKEDLTFGGELLNGASEILGSVSESYDKETLLKVLNKADNRLTTVDDTLKSVINILEYINNIRNKESLTNAIIRLSTIEGKVSNVISEINKNIDLVNNNVILQPETIKALNDKVNDASSRLQDLIGKYDTTIVPGINGALDNLNSMSNDALGIIDSTQDAMPDVKNVLSLLSKGTKLTNEELKKVKDDFPEIKKSFNNMVNKIKKLDKKEDIDEILKIIKGDWKEKTSFLISPVEIQTNKLFQIPNYGSAMSPFYTTLAIWVGGLILVSVLTVNAKPFEDGTVPTAREVYFGKYLTFITIGILQGAIVTLGDIFILKTYVMNPVYFVLFGMFISMIFITIIYSTVSVFGNVGKAICIIFLVLQVAASGGTFPVEVMSGFFKGINPFLPFKYAIEAMRGLVGGIVPELIQRDIIMLVSVAAIFILIAVFFKKIMNKRSEGFVKKLKESDIVEH